MQACTTLHYYSMYMLLELKNMITTTVRMHCLTFQLHTGRRISAHIQHVKRLCLQTWRAGSQLYRMAASAAREEFHHIAGSLRDWLTVRCLQQPLRTKVELHQCYTSHAAERSGKHRLLSCRMATYVRLAQAVHVLPQQIFKMCVPAVSLLALVQAVRTYPALLQCFRRSTYITDTAQLLCES
jgi:hypothetical protein